MAPVVYVDFPTLNFATVFSETLFSPQGYIDLATHFGHTLLLMVLVQPGFQHEKATPFVTVCCTFRHFLLLLLLMAFLILTDFFIKGKILTFISHKCYVNFCHILLFMVFFY